MDISVNGFSPTTKPVFSFDPNGRNFYSGISGETVPNNYYYTTTMSNTRLIIFQRNINDTNNASGSITFNTRYYGQVILIGGGAGGSTSVTTTGGLGGGGGYYKKTSINILPGTTIDINVGGGGTSNNNGNPSYITIYGRQYIANGGNINAAQKGKKFSDFYNNIYCYGAGGGGGGRYNGGNTGSGGDGGFGYNTNGGYGFGLTSTAAGGGGGGYYVSNTNKNYGSPAVGSAGGAGGGGIGVNSICGGGKGANGTSTQTGGNGLICGGGGGGSFYNNFQPGPGGNGGVGGGGGGGGGGTTSNSGKGLPGGNGGINGGGGGGGGNGNVGGTGGIGLIVFQLYIPIPCFKEGSKILTNIGYIPIEYLKKGDLVRTFRNDCVPIYMIGKRTIYHAANQERIKDQLYKCTKDKYPQVFEDLVITGCHSILVDEFKDDNEEEKAKEVYEGTIYKTDDKYRLPACADDRTSVYETQGEYTVYHIALENNDYYMNYGIYANGLLVETCSKRFLNDLSNMLSDNKMPPIITRTIEKVIK
jgi:hypothetical protein